MTGFPESELGWTLTDFPQNLGHSSPQCRPSKFFATSMLSFDTFILDIMVGLRLASADVTAIVATTGLVS
jgi:hypothetical protein